MSAGVKLPPAPKKANPLDKITPVTDALLQNPPIGEWLTWRRGFDYQGFSPLKQITKSNVNNLRVAWTWTLSPGANEATPLVHDGVMFLHSPGDKLEALDAATGDLLWQYARLLPPGVSMAQFALRWILMFNAVTCAIPGGKRPSQVADNCAASDLPELSEAAMRAIRDLYDARIRGAVHQRW